MLCEHYFSVVLEHNSTSTSTVEASLRRQISTVEASLRRHRYVFPFHCVFPLFLVVIVSNSEIGDAHMTNEIHIIYLCDVRCFTPYWCYASFCHYFRQGDLEDDFIPPANINIDTASVQLVGSTVERCKYNCIIYLLNIFFNFF